MKTTPEQKKTPGTPTQQQIDVMSVFELKTHITNPGTNVLWQIAPKAGVTLFVKFIDITQRDDTTEQVIAQLVNMTAAATVTAAVVDNTLIRHDPATDPSMYLDLTTTTTGHTGTGGTSGNNELWCEGFPAKTGPIFRNSPLRLNGGTLWGIRFKAAPPSSRIWTVTMELEAG